jgi:hypothetical protein
MAQEWVKKYLTMKPEVNKIFDDLEAYQDFCRFELCDFNPATLYNRDSAIYRAFQDSQRPRRPWNSDRKPRGEYQGRNNDYNRSGNGNNNYRGPRNEQSFSR